MLVACTEAVKQFFGAINSKAQLLKVSVFRDVFTASKHSSHLQWSALGHKLSYRQHQTLNYGEMGGNYISTLHGEKM